MVAIGHWRWFADHQTHHVARNQKLAGEAHETTTEIPARVTNMIVVHNRLTNVPLRRMRPRFSANSCKSLGLNILNGYGIVVKIYIDESPITCLRFFDRGLEARF
jgi:hypothetical protein